MPEILSKRLSLNIAGLWNLTKRKRIQKFLGIEQPTIVYCQKTHILNREIHWLRQMFCGNIYHAPGTSRTCGTMIGIAYDSPWQLKEEFYDPQGSYVLLNGFGVGQPLLLIGIYAPHTSQLPFWSGITDRVVSVNVPNILLLGDFNATVDNYIDRSCFTAAAELPGVFKDFSE